MICKKKINDKVLGAKHAFGDLPETIDRLTCSTSPAMTQFTPEKRRDLPPIFINDQMVQSANTDEYKRSASLRDSSSQPIYFLSLPTQVSGIMFRTDG